ncbi:MAG: RNA ligase (ATP) [Methanomassiliicoccales archaeon]
MANGEKGRALAYVEKILSLDPILGADVIEKAKIRGWDVVVKKGEFKVGDVCVYIECDSVLPLTSWSIFLVDKNKPDKPIRLRTITLRGQRSQGLAIPLNNVFTGDRIFYIGENLTEELGITKYDPPIPACLAGQVWGDRPWFVIKTDEERIQNVPDLIKEIAGIRLYETVKMDGTSGSFFYKEDNFQGQDVVPFGVCSREMWLKESDPNTFWQMARKYDLAEKMKDACAKMGGPVIVQGEVCGEGIQKNRLGIKGHELFVFNVMLVNGQKYLDYEDFMSFCGKYELQTVPVINDNLIFNGNETVDNILDMADGLYPSGHLREGVVFRSVIERQSAVLKGRLSFKAVSNKFLAKVNE